MARLRAAAAAVVLLLIVGAVPVALLLWGVSPAALGNLTRPDDGSALLGALTLVGWLAWMAFVVSVAVEAVNLIGRRAVPLRVPLLGGLQAVAGALVFAVLSPNTVSAAVAPQVSPTPVVAEIEAAAEIETAAEDGAAEGSEGVLPSYTVRPGDDLWSIAEQVLGQGSRWRLIAEANPGLLANPTVDLTPGVRLVVPALRGEPVEADEPRDGDEDRPGPKAAAKPVAGRAKTAAEARTVTVVKGDTLSGLAQEHLGAASKWPRIYRANTDRIQDPDEIDVGWKLVIPATKAAAPKPGQARPVRKPVTRPEASAPQGEAPGPQAGVATPRVEASVPRVEVPVPEAESPTAPHADQPVETPGETTTTAAPATAANSDPGWPLIGGLSGLAAAMIVAGLNVNRLSQLRARPVGRRIAHPPIDVRRYETALGRRERPETTGLLEKALRALGAHAHAGGTPLPPLDRVTVGERTVTFTWSDEPAGDPPAGFQRTARGWRLTSAAADRLPASAHPVPFPALVTIGRDPDGNWLMVDLESRSPLALDGSRALQHAVAAAMAVELSCSPWASELSLTVVGGDEMFIRAACPELVVFHAEPEPALSALEARVAERDADESAVALLRVDPDRAEAGAAQILLVADELDDEQRTRFDALLEDRDLGVGGVIAGSGSSSLILSGTEDEPQGVLGPDGQELRPQLVAAHTRAAIGTIFAATDEASEAEAPWWSAAANVRALVPRREPVTVDEPEPELPSHPYLRLIGPIELLGAAAPAPTRARRQCEEYCAWLLENPRSTATRMATELVVAETTRRSNMSRLRSWLGADADGNAYLPEAYSGRIELHPEVESDWQRVRVLTAPGLNRLAPDTLVKVLEFVRGAPLADAAPGQWRWAEELRTDISSLMRDAGVLLTRWALEHQNLDVARWAAARALLAAPEDELLLVERINTEVLAGNTAEVQRLVRWVTGQARVLGVDLAPDTVAACQRALEGRLRPRVAP